jgi:hypothetical protein
MPIQPTPNAAAPEPKATAAEPRAEPKAKAPPPSLQDNEEREAERKRLSLQFLTNLNRASKAQREARVLTRNSE